MNELTFQQWLDLAQAFLIPIAGFIANYLRAIHRDMQKIRERLVRIETRMGIDPDFE